MASFGRRLDHGLRLLAFVLLLALLASVVIGVVMRQLGQPVGWSDELAQYLLVWTGFTGLMIASRRRSHIRIDVFINMLPVGARRIAEIIIQLAVIGFALAVLRFGAPLIERNWDIEWVSLPLPAGLLYLPLPLVAAILIGQAVIAIIETVRGTPPAEPEPGAQPL